MSALPSLPSRLPLCNCNVSGYLLPHWNYDGGDVFRALRRTKSSTRIVRQKPVEPCQLLRRRPPVDKPIRLSTRFGICCRSLKTITLAITMIFCCRVNHTRIARILAKKKRKAYSCIKSVRIQILVPSLFCMDLRRQLGRRFAIS